MKINLLVLLSFVSMAALAQPTLTASAYVPVGSSITASVHSGAIVPGGSGAGQTWNFSGLTYSAIGQLLFLNPANTSCPSAVPSANYVTSIPNGALHYYVRTATDMQLLRLNLNSATCLGGATYSDYLKSYQFPFSYLDSYTDTYAADDGSSGTINVQYDGYGTVVTPFGTFNNCGRVKSVDGAKTDYTWFTGSSLQYPLLSTIDGNQNTIVYSNPLSKVNEIENSINTVVYPNPFSTQATFRINSTVLLKNPELHFYDVVGNEVKSIFITENETTLINHDLSTGFYYYILTGNGISLSTGKIIIQ